MSKFDQNLINFSNTEALQEQIREIKNSENVILFAHNYQRPEIQVLADVIGDSLELAKAIRKFPPNSRIIYCAVTFMAETAAILNPDATILIPQWDARCPMAGMVSGSQLQRYKKQHPETPIVLYINSTAETKQYADVICTSSNAIEICRKITEEFQTNKVAFSPDENLGKYVQSKLDIEMDFIPDHGYCYVHRLFSAADIETFRNNYPNAKVLIHPECKPEVIEAADFVGSTAAMYNYVKNNPEEEFGIGTEEGLIDRILRELPEIPAENVHKIREDAVCYSQKKITLESILDCLQHLTDPQYQLQLDPFVRENAFRPIQKMFDLMEN